MILYNFINYIHPDKRKTLYSVYYKSRHLIIYTFIGFLSIIVELQIRKFLITSEINNLFASFVSIPPSVILAFYLNIKFNFNIQRKKIINSFVFFILISFGSLLLQFFLKSITNLSYNYELNRLLISGSCFIIFYILHRKFSFKNYVKVGVAIYANGVEDIGKIFNKIGPYPDFIHVDIVDKTFLKKAKPVKSYKLEIIKSLWPSKEIHVHIMSKNPLKWVKEVKKYSDKTFIHFESVKNLNKFLKKNKFYKKKLGLAVSINTNFEDYKKYLNLFDNLLLLTIKKPGYSGQDFLKKSFNTIKKINSYTKNRKFNLCIDGGINYDISKKIKCEEVVSGSFILNSNDPIKTYLKLKYNK